MAWCFFPFLFQFLNYSLNGVQRSHHKIRYQRSVSRQVIYIFPLYSMLAVLSFSSKRNQNILYSTWTTPHTLSNITSLSITSLKNTITPTMNSLIRQTTCLGAQCLRVSARRPAARKFSLASQIFESNTVIKNGAKPDYRRLAKHIIDPLLLYAYHIHSCHKTPQPQRLLHWLLVYSYFPFMGFVIGWPLLAQKVLDGSIWLQGNSPKDAEGWEEDWRRVVMDVGYGGFD